MDYAELTRDPAGVMRMVAAFCGIDYLDAMSDPRSSGRAVATASAVQVRDRVVRRDVPKVGALCRAPAAAAGRGPPAGRGERYRAAGLNPPPRRRIGLGMLMQAMPTPTTESDTAGYDAGEDAVLVRRAAAADVAASSCCTAATTGACTG